jgi:DNA-binding beta-propeller fold protein YncE
MIRFFIIYVLLAAVLLVPCAGNCAEVLKVKFLTTVNSDDKEKPVQLLDPLGVTCNDNLLIVADTGNGRLVRYTLAEREVKGGTEIKIPELVYPVRVQMNSKGDIYVFDGKNRRIVQLNSAGAFVANFDLRGVPAPATIVPRSFKIDSNNNLYLLDIFGERVVMADATGNYVKQYPFPKPYGFISDLAVNENGDIFLLDSVNASIFVVKKNESNFVPLVKDLKEYLNFAANITTDYRGVIYLTDQNGAAVVAFGQDGTLLGRQLSLGWKNGQLFYPSQISVTKSGIICIADRGNSRVQLFELLK